jgi:hypothetical protein
MLIKSLEFNCLFIFANKILQKNIISLINKLKKTQGLWNFIYVFISKWQIWLKINNFNKFLTRYKWFLSF